MAEKPATLSRRDFVKSSAATWAVATFAPYATSLAATRVAGLSASDFLSPPVSARPMVLWAWLNGHVDLRQITRELEAMKSKGMRGAIIWDVGSLADPEGIIPAGPAFLGPESLAAIHHASQCGLGQIQGNLIV